MDVVILSMIQVEYVEVEHVLQIKHNMIQIKHKMFQIKQDESLNVFSMITGINKLNALIKHVPCNCRSKFTGRKCNSNKEWNNNKCQCECEKQ